MIQLERAGAGAAAARRRVVGLAPDRDRAAAAANRARLAADLPRRQGDDHRRPLPGRPHAHRPRRADAGAAPLPEWILAPLAPYEREGDVPNVVFPCGLVHDVETDEIRLYYGAADTSICLATGAARGSARSRPGRAPALASTPAVDVERLAVLRRGALLGAGAPSASSGPVSCPPSSASADLLSWASTSSHTTCRLTSRSRVSGIRDSASCRTDPRSTCDDRARRAGTRRDSRPPSARVESTLDRGSDASRSRSADGDRRRDIGSTRKPVVAVARSAPAIEPRAEGDHRRAAGHRLDDAEPERLVEADQVQQRVAPRRGAPTARSAPTGPTKEIRSPSSRGATRSSKYAWSWTIPAITSGRPDASATSIASAVPLSGWIRPKKSR